MTTTLYSNTKQPIRGQSFSFPAFVVSQANAHAFKTSVTLAAGDVKVSKDGGAYANITSLPVEISTSGHLVVSLSAAEMTADEVSVKFSDVAGAEWDDVSYTIYPVAAQTVGASDPDNAGISAIKAKTDNLPSDPADESLLEAAITAATAPLMTSASYTAPDNAGISAIKAKTDNLPSDPADESLLEAAITAATAPLMTAAGYTAPDNAGITGIKAVTDKLDGMVQAGGDGFQYTTPALENAPGGAGEIVVHAHVAISATQAKLVATGTLALLQYYTFAQSVPSTLTENLSTADEIWLALKRNKRDSDSQSVVFMSKTGGLTVLNGVPYGTAGNGVLGVSGVSGDWYIDLDLHHDVTALLATGEYFAEIKALLSDHVTTIPVWSGIAVVGLGAIKKTAL